MLFCNFFLKKTSFKYYHTILIVDVLHVDFHLSLNIFIGKVETRFLHGRISMKNSGSLVPKERERYTHT